MTGYLIDFKGNEYKLPLLISWSVSHGLGTPCDAFEMSFVYDGSMADMLYGAVRFRGVYEDETVFYGVVDEYEISIDAGGATVSVAGRGMAALLLDNEAAAAEYGMCTISDVLNNHVYPWGIKNVKTAPMNNVYGYTVASGASQWSAVYNFAQFSGEVTPHFSKDGTLLLTKPEGKKLTVDEWSGAFDIKFAGKRYGVISEVLVKNKALGTSALVKNEKFISEGGSCRRVINVPRRTGYDRMRYTGQFQIERSEEEYMSCTLS